MVDTKESLNRLSQLDTCALSDALDKLKMTGVVMQLKQLTSTQKLFGKVVTMSLGNAVDNDSHSNKSHLGAAAIDLGNEDNVIVIEHKERLDVAGWGGILSLAASKKGIKGVVIDGAVRDIDESRSINFPIYGKCVVPVTARGRIVEVAVNEPVIIGGVNVKSGDYIIGDGSGVVFIRSEVIGKVLEIAEKIVSREKAILASILNGMPVSRAMDKQYENMIDGKF